MGTKSFKIHDSRMATKCTVFTDNNPPAWLLTPEYFWWYENEVLPLEISEHAGMNSVNIIRIL